MFPFPAGLILCILISPALKLLKMTPSIPDLSCGIETNHKENKRQLRVGALQ